MRSIFSLVAAIALSSTAFAQQAATTQDHAAHHPAGSSAPATSAKKPAARPAPPAAAASAPKRMGADMGKQHDKAHQPGGMHDQMHGKDGKMKGGSMSATPPASAASN